VNYKRGDSGDRLPSKDGKEKGEANMAKKKTAAKKPAAKKKAAKKKK
jgi:hypothetical protein